MIGQPQVSYDDASYSWVTRAAAKFNLVNAVPSQWEMEVDVQAGSGKKTSQFGDGNYSLGPSWPASGTQVGYMQDHLSDRSESWNVVSVTGGANDADFAGELKDFYTDHYAETTPQAPWNVSTTAQSTDCVNTQAIWNRLNAVPSGETDTLDELITANLQGVVEVAADASNGVRVLAVGYPYVSNSSNDCFEDDGSWHGAESVVDALNDNLSGLTGSNVRYINVSTGFGNSPITDELIQTTRLYGYPHPNNKGQNLIRDLAVAKLVSAW